MYQLIQQPEEQLRILFRNTTQRMGLNESIVEKDFWVCLTLDYLFHDCPWKDAFTFKGGTSLSKCYGLIHRFSEDIDLILDWRVLGYGLNEPWEQRSNTKQDAFNKEANRRAEIFLAEELLPVLRKERVYYTFEETKMIGDTGYIYDDTDPLLSLMAFGRIIETGDWVGDIIGISDEKPEEYELLEEIHFTV